MANRILAAIAIVFVVQGGAVASEPLLLMLEVAMYAIGQSYSSFWAQLRLAALKLQAHHLHLRPHRPMLQLQLQSQASTACILLRHRSELITCGPKLDTSSAGSTFLPDLTNTT